MKKIWIALMTIAIIGLGAYMALNLTYYRGGGLAAEVKAIRDKEEAERQRKREAREAERARPANTANNSQRRPAQGRGQGQSSARYDIDLNRAMRGVTLSDQQKSQADGIVAQHRQAIGDLRRKQREAQDTARLSLLSEILRLNSGKLPDPAWNDMAHDDLAKAAADNPALSAEAKAAAAAQAASWQEANTAFTAEMRAARDAATNRLLDLLTPEQRAQYDAARASRNATAPAPEPTASAASK